MFRSLAAAAVRTASTRAPASTRLAAPARAAAATAAARRSVSTQPPPAAAGAEAVAPGAASHYLVTLVRSPLHLSHKVKATAAALGLHKRLHSVLVPVTPVTQGYLLRCKEIVAVRPVSPDQLAQYASQEWRTRPGVGNQGAGVRIVEPAGPNSVVRVGSERARGDERGFRIVA